MRAAVALSLLLAPSVAMAHAVLTYPPPRTTELKSAPCGAAGSTRGTNVTTLAPGATIQVLFKETIDHPGHYRISFDEDGQDFFMPTDFNTNTEGQLNVIDDLIPDIQGTLPAGGRPYMVDITLPNVECANCTLQLIQMMTETATFEAANDIYFSCADITLAANAPDAGTNAGGDDAGVDPGGSGSGGPNSGVESGGCSAGGGGAGGLSALALLGLVGWRRRRR
jgi:uncharacterized protein (TIGR03382 family)